MNITSKPLELKFSDLKEDEKQKYLQFLVANNIFFEEEKENNNYIATIKFTQKVDKCESKNIMKNEPKNKIKSKQKIKQ